ncbi:hypothetical protein AeNC1_004081 [Aphanomyces euteiches]|nr:hypothetical protein AeNC1_004081 [Aphanomyces euteiches]
MFRDGKPLAPPMYLNLFVVWLILVDRSELEPMTPTTQGSQLVEATPQIDLPQRMDAPMTARHVNTPARVPTMTRDARIRQTVFSASAIARRKQQQKQLQPTLSPSMTTFNLDKPKECAAKTKRLKDYSMLAASSNRAGRAEQEALAYFCMGIIYDNSDDFVAAIDVYKKALHLLEGSDNVFFQSLVLSCIGVDYQLASSGIAPYTGRFVSADNAELRLALTFHQRHAALNVDDAGQFVAHTNLGLTCGSLGQFADAAKHHQEALRLAIRLASAYGQSLAVGNLGLLASRQGDVATATACMDQHLQLLQSVQDKSAEVNAWIQLGLLAFRQLDADKATRYFEQAYHLAKNLNEIGIMKQASCYLGIARATLHMPTYFASLS